MITITIMKYELWTIVIYCVYSLKVNYKIDHQIGHLYI